MRIQLPTTKHFGFFTLPSMKPLFYTNFKFPFLSKVSHWFFKDCIPHKMLQFLVDNLRVIKLSIQQAKWLFYKQESNTKTTIGNMLLNYWLPPSKSKEQPPIRTVFISTLQKLHTAKSKITKKEKHKNLLANVQPHTSSVQHIHKPSRGGHQEMTAPIKLLQLTANICSTINHTRAHIRTVGKLYRKQESQLMH